MISFDDYPYRVIRDAFETIIGRIVLVTAAMVLGGWLAGWTATQELRSSLIGVLGLLDFSMMSILAGMGFIVFPAILCFLAAFIRWEWPLWTCLLCSVVMWWNIHGTIRWAVYDGPMAKKMQAINDSIKGVLEKHSSGTKSNQPSPKPHSK